MDTKNFLDLGDSFQLPDGNYLRGIFSGRDVLRVPKDVTFKLLTQEERKQAYHAVYGNELCLYSDMLFNGRVLPFDRPVDGTNYKPSKYRGYGTMISANAMTMAQAMVLLKLSVTTDTKIGYKAKRKVTRTVELDGKKIQYTKKQTGVHIIQKDNPLPMIAATINPFLDEDEVKDKLQVSRPRRFMDIMYDAGLIVRGGKYKNNAKLVDAIRKEITLEDLKVFRDAMHDEREGRIRDAIGDEFDEIEVYGFKCQCCGTLNQTMVETVSYTQEKILNSKSGARTFLDNAWNSVDIPMCCTCWSAAGIIPDTKISMCAIYSVKDYFKFEYVRGFLLDQLKLTKATDFFSLMDKGGQKSVIEHDLAIIRRSLTDVDKLYVQVGADASRKETEIIADWYGISVIKYSLQFTSFNPTLVTHIQCCAKYVLAKMSVGAAAIYYSPMPIKTNQDLLYIDPQNDISSFPNSVNAPKIETAIIFVNSKKATTSLLANLLTQFNIVVTIAFKPSTYVKYLDVNSELHMSMVGSLTSKELNKKSTSVFLSNPFIRGLQDTSLIGSVTCDNDVLKAITWTVPNRKMVNSVTHMAVPRKQTYTLKMPLPRLDGGLSSIVGFNIVSSEVTIHMSLLRALCLYNISGQVSQDKMINYAVAFSYRKFIIGVNVIREDYVEPDVIFTHVLLSRLIMMRVNSKYKINTGVASILGMVKAISPALTSLANLLFDTIGGFFKKTLTSKGIPTHLLRELVDLNTLTDQYSELMDNSQFTVLCDNVLKHSSKVMQSSVTSIEFEKEHCVHYHEASKLPVTKVVCICCLLPVAATGASLCSACKIKGINKPIVEQPNTDVLPDEILYDEQKPIIEDDVVDADMLSIINITEQVKDYEMEAYAMFGVEPVNQCLNMYDVIMAYNSQDMEPFTIMIPFAPMGRSGFTSEAVKLKDDPIVIPNSATASCGFEAFNHATRLGLTLSRFREYCESNQDFSTDDLQMVASIVDVNLAIVCKESVLLSKNIPSDLFFTIMHSDYNDEPIPHYYPATFDIIADHFLYMRLNPNLDDEFRFKVENKMHFGFNGNFSTITDRKDNLILETIAQKLSDSFEKKTTVIDEVSIERFDGEIWFCVSNIVDDKIDTMQIRIKEDLYSTIDWLTDFEKPKLLLDDVLTHDMPSEIPDNWAPWAISFIKTQQDIYSRLVSDKESDRTVKFLRKPTIVKAKNVSGNLAFRNTGKIKTGDVVIIQYEDQHVKVKVKIMRGLVVTPLKYKTSDVLSLQTYKISAASILRSLVNCLKMTLNGTFVKEKLAMATVTLGVPGCGKTTEICEVEEDFAVVVLTQGAKQNLISKRCKGRIFTFESLFRNFTVYRVSKLIIDEATQFNYFMLSMILPNFEFDSLCLYGDTNQIPYKDMSSTFGLRWAGNITQYDGFLTDIFNNNKTYRFGEPLCGVLRAIVPAMESVAQHRTEFSIKTGLQSVQEAIQFATTNFDIDQFLTFYSDVSNSVRKYTNIPVDQVHSYQGREDNVVVVISTFEAATRGYGLGVNAQYLFSALSRAKIQMVLLVVGGPATNDDFSTYYIHGMVKTVAVESKVYETLIADKALKEKIKESVKNAGVDASVDIKYVKSNLVVTVKKFMVTLATIVVSPTTLKVTSISSDVEDKILGQILDNMDKETPNENVGHVNVDEIAKSELILNKIDTFSKRAFFLALCLELGNLEYLDVFDLNGEEIRVMKTFHNCPVTAGIVFTWPGKTTVTVSNINNFKRTLDIQGECKQHQINFVTDFINDTMLPSHPLFCFDCSWMQYIGAWIERLTKINYWLDYLKRDEKTVSEKCRTEKKKLKNISDLLFNGMDNFYPIHSQYSTRWHFKSNKFTIRNINTGHTVNLRVKRNASFSQIVAWAVGWNFSLSNFYIKYDAAVLGMFEGMVLPIESHIEAETIVGKEYMQRMALLKSVTKTELKDIIWVSDKTRKLFGKELKEWWPKSKMNSLNYNTTNENCLELLTNALAMPFVGKEHLDYYWAGLITYSPLICSRHYMKIFNCMKNNLQQGFWQATLPTTTKLWNNYLAATKNENAILNIVNEIPSINNQTCVVFDFLLGEQEEVAIMDLVNSGARVVGLLCINNAMKGKGFANVKIQGTRGLCSLNGGSMVFTLRKWACDFYLKLNTVVSVKNEPSLRIKVLKTLSDVVLVELVSNKTISTIHSYISENFVSDENILVQMPTINLDIGQLVAGKPLFEVTDTIISRRAYQHMKLRMMTGDNSIEALLAYARTLGSTFETTVTGPVEIYNFGIEKYVATARYVWQKYSGFEQTLRLFEQLLSLTNGNDFLNVNLIGIVKTALKVAGMATDHIQTYLTSFNENLPHIIGMITGLVSKPLDNFEFREKVIKGKWVTQINDKGNAQEEPIPILFIEPKKKDINITFKQKNHDITDKKTQTSNSNQSSNKNSTNQQKTTPTFSSIEKFKNQPLKQESKKVSLSEFLPKKAIVGDKHITMNTLNTPVVDDLTKSGLHEKVIVGDSKTKFDSPCLMLCGLGNRLQSGINYMSCHSELKIRWTNIDTGDVSFEQLFEPVVEYEDTKNETMLEYKNTFVNYPKTMIEPSEENGGIKLYTYHSVNNIWYDTWELTQWPGWEYGAYRFFALMKFQDQIIEEAQKYTNKYGINLNCDCVIHVRLGDRAWANSSIQIQAAIKSQAHRMQSILTKKLKFFILTDDRKELLEKFPDANQFGVTIIPSEHDRFTTPGQIESAAQWLLMASCKYMILNRGSTFNTSALIVSSLVNGVNSLMVLPMSEYNDVVSLDILYQLKVDYDLHPTNNNMLSQVKDLIDYSSVNTRSIEPYTLILENPYSGVHVIHHEAEFDRYLPNISILHKKEEHFHQVQRYRQLTNNETRAVFSNANVVKEQPLAQLLVFPNIFSTNGGVQKYIKTILTNGTFTNLFILVTNSSNGLKDKTRISPSYLFSSEKKYDCYVSKINQKLILIDLDSSIPSLVMQACDIIDALTIPIELIVIDAMILSTSYKMVRNLRFEVHGLFESPLTLFHSKFKALPFEKTSKVYTNFGKDYEKVEKIFGYTEMMTHPLSSYEVIGLNQFSTVNSIRSNFGNAAIVITRGDKTGHEENSKRLREVLALGCKRMVVIVSGLRNAKQLYEDPFKNDNVEINLFTEASTHFEIPPFGKMALSDIVYYCTYFVHCTKNEPWGLAISEAYGAGLKIVGATDSGFYLYLVSKNKDVSNFLDSDIVGGEPIGTLGVDIIESIKNRWSLSNYKPIVNVVNVHPLLLDSTILKVHQNSMHDISVELKMLSVYECEDIIDEVLFNPQTTMNCLIMCINWIADKKKVKVPAFITESTADPTLPSVLSTACWLHNLGVGYLFLSHLYFVDNSTLEYLITVTPDLEEYHARVCSVKPLIEFKRQVIRDDLLDHPIKSGLTVPEGWLSWAELKLAKMIQSPSIDEATNYRSSGMVLASRIEPYIYCCVKKRGVVEGALFSLIVDDGVIIPAVCTRIEDHFCVLHTSKPSNLNIVGCLHMGTRVNNAKKTVVLNFNNEVLESWATKKHLISIGHKLQSLPVAYGILQANQIMYVFDYDNRAHHWRDARKVTAQNLRLIDTNFEDTSYQEKIVSTFDLPIRFGFSKGNLVKIFEFASRNEAIMVAKLIKKENVMACIYFDVLEDTSEFERKLHAVENKLTVNATNFEMNEEVLEELIKATNNSKALGRLHLGMKFTRITRSKLIGDKLLMLLGMKYIVVSTDNILIFVPSKLWIFRSPLTGKGLTPLNSKMLTIGDEFRGLTSYIKQNSSNTAKLSQISPAMQNIPALNNAHLFSTDPSGSISSIAWETNTALSRSDIVDENENKGLDLLELNLTYKDLTDIEFYCDLPTKDLMDFYENTDMTHMVNLINYKSVGKYRSNAYPNGIIKKTKALLNKYGFLSRSYVEGIVYESINSTNYRLRGYIQLQTMFVKDHFNETNKVFSTYCVADWQQHCERFMSEPKNFDVEETVKWIKKHEFPVRVHEKLVNFLSGFSGVQDYKKANIHMKLESILKLDTWDQVANQKGRIIVWQEQFLAALFAPIINHCKKNLVSILNSKTIYVDGLTPSQISSVFRGLESGESSLFEADFAKQDRQTPPDQLKFEVIAMQLLGFDTVALQVYSSIYNKWFYKMKTMWGTEEPKRHTGSPTTGFGNTMNSLRVYRRLVNRNKDNIKLFALLSDDVVIVTKRKMDLKKHRRDSKMWYNMVSEIKQSDHCVSFIGCLVYKTSLGGVELGPNLVRMKYRYEVTNGVSEVTAENMLMRTLSYATLLGDTSAGNRVKKSLNHPNLTLENWYNEADNILACAAYYNVNEHHVISLINELVQMMTVREITLIEYRYFSEKRDRRLKQ